jgi:hypothetical protein
MAAGSTYTPIATTTLGSSAASVSFSSFSGYTDVVLVIAARGTSTSSQIYATLNSDSGTNYSYTELYGYSGGAISDRASNQTQMRLYGMARSDYAANEFGYVQVQFMNYSNTTTNKTAIARGSSSMSTEVDARVHLYRSTSSITSISLAPTTGSFATGSTFTLYGIAAA